MKRTILLLLTLSLILAVFSSCGHKTVDPIDDQTSSSPSEDTSVDSTTEKMTIESATTDIVTEERLTSITTEHDNDYTYTYTIEKADGKYYICFGEQHGDLGGPDGVIAPIQFSSLDALKYDIPNGNIDANTWRILWDDYITAMRMPLYDVEHIWQPKVPVGWTVQDTLNWGIEYYGFYLNSDDGSDVVRLYVYTEEFYNENLLPRAEECLKDHSTQDSPARKIQSGDITVYFYPRTTNRYEILFSNGKYFCYIQGDLPSDLTDEEILAFGVEEYLG